VTMLERRRSARAALEQAERGSVTGEPDVLPVPPEAAVTHE
jgi:hypothetical protein